MTDIACPGRIEHTVLSSHGTERLQGSVDSEVKVNGIIDEWPEHWESARASRAFLCPKCQRLFVGVDNNQEVWVFKLERIGVESEATGIDSQCGSEAELMELAKEQSGESPMCT